MSPRFHVALRMLTLDSSDMQPLSAPALLDPSQARGIPPRKCDGRADTVELSPTNAGSSGLGPEMAADDSREERALADGRLTAAPTNCTNPTE